MPPPPPRRLFLALDLPSALTAVLTAWRPAIPGARWIAEDHLHLTVRFLGPTDAERQAAITGVLESLRSDPVPVTTGTLLRLPSARRPRALAVAVDDSRALRAVVGRLDRRLDEVGVPARDLAFLPHVTLARFRPPDPTALRKALRGIDPPRVSGVAASVSLVESLPDDTGAHYATLLRVPLVETAPTSAGEHAMPISTHAALRYVTPLREGGSLPALVETDAGLFVVKFRGAGQGARALLAELIVGGLARELGLPLPDLAVVDLQNDFGKAEPDPEIQDILRGSAGPNVGLGFVPGAFAYEPAAHADLIDPALAADIVWLDALTTNIDRTARNPNLLVARGKSVPAHAPDGPQLWLIDHGAALYFHHNWASVDTARAQAPFAPIRDHVLLPIAGPVEAADARLAPRLDEGTVGAILADAPDALLMDAPEGREPAFDTPDAARDAYATFFRERLAGPRRWVDEAVRAQAERPDATPLPYRR